MEQHGKLASLPELIRDQCALGMLSVLRAAAHSKKGREKAYANIILWHVNAGHAAGASLCSFISRGSTGKALKEYYNDNTTSKAIVQAH